MVLERGKIDDILVILQIAALLINIGYLHLLTLATVFSILLAERSFIA